MRASLSILFCLFKYVVVFLFLFYLFLSKLNFWLLNYISGKAFPGDGLPQTEESPLVVCFGEMLIDFVPTTSGISLAEAPAFKKAPGGAPANVAVGIARLGGSSAFIGKVLLLISETFCSVVVTTFLSN